MIKINNFCITQLSDGRFAIDEFRFGKWNFWFCATSLSKALRSTLILIQARSIIRVL